MKTIQDVVNVKVAAMISEGTITKLVEDNVEKAINKALEDQFGCWGSITKQLEQIFKDNLRIDQSKVNLDTYNEQMAVAIKTKMNGFFAGQAFEKFSKEIDILLEPSPKEIAADDFLKKIASFWKTDEPWDAEDLDEYMTVEIEQYREDKDDWKIKIWKQKESSSGYSKRSNSADLDLFVLDGTLRINHRQCYNPTSFSAPEGYIFKLYAAGTKITGLGECSPEDLDLVLKKTDY